MVQRLNYFMHVLMHRCIYDNARDYLKDSIVSVPAVHEVFTTNLSSGDPYVPCPNSKLF